jgi:hypothetical protein
LIIQPIAVDLSIHQYDGKFRRLNKKGKEKYLQQGLSLLPIFGSGGDP